MNLRKLWLSTFLLLRYHDFCRYLRFLSQAFWRLTIPVSDVSNAGFLHFQRGGEVRNGHWRNLGNQWEPCEWDAIQEKKHEVISNFRTDQLQLLLQKQNVGMEKHSKKQDLSYTTKGRALPPKAVPFKQARRRIQKMVSRCPTNILQLVVEPTPLKNMIVKMGIFP